MPAHPLVAWTPAVAELTTFRKSTRLFRAIVATCAMLLVLGNIGRPIWAAGIQDAQWIWTAEQDAAKAGTDPIFVRKELEIREWTTVSIEVTCDNRYELFFNGERIGADDEWTTVESHDVTKHVVRGQNVVAIRAENEAVGHAGLAAALTIAIKEKPSLTVASDKSWFSSTSKIDGWQKIDFVPNKTGNNAWHPSKPIGPFGKTKPWSEVAAVTPNKAGRSNSGGSTKSGKGKSMPALSERFTPLPGFKVEQVLAGEAGSLVAMTFTEHGDLIGSAENGNLMLIRLPRPGQLEATTTQPIVSVYSDKLTNCQGILCYAGHVYAVGNGPDGTAFYRLTDSDKNGQADKLETLFKFKGGMGEHGPHQPVVGPDGLIYLMIGNHAAYGGEMSAKSPHHHYYEGDLLRPRYEDANGHAVGVAAPGGTVIRTDKDGKNVELYCGGFRNAYDIAFNPAGELFTYDSDMEWDIGLPWHRHTRVNHIIPGAEFGWRSGSPKWPDYYIDSLGATIDIGRGSPTGVMFYTGNAYPKAYRGDMILCDWSRGYLIGVRHKREGGSYVGEQYTFLEGRPLNVSDAEMGPDGNVYFCTGGRGTAGGVFRVVYDAVEKSGSASTVKPTLVSPERGKLPDVNTAWGRAAIESQKQSQGEAAWADEYIKVISDPKADEDARVAALDILQRIGPAPSAKLLIELTNAKSTESLSVRAKATYLLGLRNEPAAATRLIELLSDFSPLIRRQACESITRSGVAAPVSNLIGQLGDPDRHVGWAARRAIERLPRDQWQTGVLEAIIPRAFSRGAVALLVLDPDRTTVDAILKQARLRLDTELANDDRLDLYRVVQLALHRGDVPVADVSFLFAPLSKRFPEKDTLLNRELFRLLAHLQDPTLSGRLIEQLDSADVDEMEKRHLAFWGRFLYAGWTPGGRDRLLEFYAAQQKIDGQGNSFKGYFANVARDVMKSLPPAEQLARIANGAKNPGQVIALVRALASSKEPLSSDQIDGLEKLDRNLAGLKEAPARELSREVLLALGRSGDARSLKYLHELFESSPERRQDVALGIAQFANGKERRAADRDLLVRSLTVVDGDTARQVLQVLAKFEPKDFTPQSQRQVLMLGLKPKGPNKEAVALMQKWTGKNLTNANDKTEAALAAWTKWFVDTYPDQPEPKLPADTQKTKWTMAQLLAHLDGDQAKPADVQRGRVVFEKGQCLKCHRFGAEGEGIGPDLSNVSRRFQRKEIVESVLYPSHVISDQFAAKSVLTNDGRQVVGIVAPTPDGVVVLQSTGEKLNIAKADIDEIVASKVSAMPDGLFDTLTLEEIADLFAFMNTAPK